MENRNILFTILLIALVAALFMAYYISKEKVCRRQRLLRLACEMIAFNIFGYLCQFKMEGTDAALMCLEIECISLMAYNVTLFGFMLSICEVRISEKLFPVARIFNILLLLAVIVTGHSSFFAENVHFLNDAYSVRITMDMGPLFIFLVIYFLMLGCVSTLMILIYVIKNPENKYMILFVICQLQAVFAYFIWQNGWIGAYNPLPLAEMIQIAVVEVVAAKYRLFEVDELAYQKMIDELPIGFILINRRHQLIYANGMAKVMIPELSLDERQDCIDDFFHSGPGNYKKDGKQYELWFREVYDRNVLNGYNITITDHTDELNYIQDMEQMKEKAEGAGALKEKFFDNMSKELREPLEEAYYRLGSFWDKEDLPEKYRKDLEDFTSICDRLNWLMNYIFEYTKMESEKQKPDVKRLESDMIEGMLKQYCDRHIHGKRDQITIQNEYEINQFFYVRQELVEKLLKELLKLAADETPNGKILVQIGNAGKLTPDELELTVTFDGGQSTHELFAYAIQDLSKIVMKLGTSSIKGMEYDYCKQMMELLDAGVIMYDRQDYYQMKIRIPQTNAIPMK